MRFRRRKKQEAHKKELIPFYYDRLPGPWRLSGPEFKHGGDPFGRPTLWCGYTCAVDYFASGDNVDPESRRHYLRRSAAGHIFPYRAASIATSSNIHNVHGERAAAPGPQSATTAAGKATTTTTATSPTSGWLRLTR